MGDYAIHAAGKESQGNYAVAFGTGTLTINRKKVTVTAKNRSKTFGNKDPQFTATVKGTLNGDTATYKLSHQKGEDAGEYTVRALGNTTQGNYEVDYKEGTFTIKRRKVTVTPNNTSKFTRAMGNHAKGHPHRPLGTTPKGRVFWYNVGPNRRAYALDEGGTNALPGVNHTLPCGNKLLWGR